MVDKWLEGKEIVNITYRLVLTEEIIDMIEAADQVIRDNSWKIESLLFSKLDKIDGVYDTDYANMVHGAEDSLWVSVEAPYHESSETWQEIERIINEHIGTTPEEVMKTEKQIQHRIETYEKELEDNMMEISETYYDNSMLMINTLKWVLDED